MLEVVESLGKLVIKLSRYAMFIVFVSFYPLQSSVALNPQEAANSMFELVSAEVDQSLEKSIPNEDLTAVANTNFKIEGSLSPSLTAVNSKSDSFSQFLDLLSGYESNSFLADNVLLWFLLSALLGCLSIFLAYSLFLYIIQGKEKEQKLSYVSTHDPLTGLYNRTGLLKFLELTSSFNRELKFSAICIDLIDFKYINYAYGEDYGDKLLEAVAHRLEKLFPGGNLVARVGINEFVIIDFGSDDVFKRESVIAKIRNSCEEGFDVEGRLISVRLNMGLSLYPNDTMDSSLLLQYSHVAMLRAKESTTSNCEYYRADMAVSTYRRIQLLRRLETAFADNLGLKLVYQPILKAEDRVLRAEALIRWDDEVLGFVAPDEFIGVAEETPIINVLNNWVINASISQISEWSHQGIMPIVAINISRFDLFYKEILSNLNKALLKYNVKSEQVIIEIRESTLFGNIENASVLEAIVGLKDQGFAIAIDDFGTGFSNFSYLNTLPIDIVKIDKSLVQNIGQDEKVYSICEAIFKLCDVMGKKCVVEGVEDLEQFELTRDMGIHYFQGYHIAKPLSPEDVENFWAHDLTNFNVTKQNISL